MGAGAQSLRGEIEQYQKSNASVSKEEIVQFLGEQMSALNSTGVSTTLVLCGPVIGTVTSTTANVLLEIDESKIMTLVATAEDGSVVTIERYFPHNEPRVFEVVGLKPDTMYKITFLGLDAAQNSEMLESKPFLKTMPLDADVKKLRVVAMSCDQPRRLLKGQEDPYERLNKLVDEKVID
jgi:hypothetical protein